MTTRREVGEALRIHATKSLLVLFVGVLLALGVSRPKALETDAGLATDNYANCRFGVTAGQNITSYDVASLNLGWYVNWGMRIAPPEPGGIEYVQMVRIIQQGADGWDFQMGQSWSALTSAVAANPGATWLIGNEPDSPFQDDMVPQAYANAYHDLYAFIKGLDPTATVGIGGIVQPTALRFSYLDSVWDRYLQTYGDVMPVELWNIHSFILRETSVAPDPEPCGDNTVSIWGAYIPPGSSTVTGELYCIRDQDKLDIFWQRIRAFRQWMADKGERDKPLIISEYGILFYEDFNDEDGVPLSQGRVGQYMTGTFDRMLTQTDPSIGYPYDGGRLVQRWAWFSLSEDPNAWGGTLFDPVTHMLRPLGQTFLDYTNAITPTVDFVAARAYGEPAVIAFQGQPVTATLKAIVTNVGNISTTQAVAVDFFDGPPGQAGTEPIGSAQLIPSGLGGCADKAVVSVSWSGLGIGAHSFYVEVDSGGTIAEADETNNVAGGTVLVSNRRVFVPTTVKDDS